MAKGSPNKDKELGLDNDPLDPKVGQAGGSVEEDLESLSDIEEGEEKVKEGQKLKELMTKKGFKSVDDLINSYSEIEKKNTELTQDVRRLQFTPTVSPAFLPSSPTTSVKQRELSIPDDPYELISGGKEKFKKFIEESGEIVREKVKEEIREEKRQEEKQRMYDEAIRKMQEDPEKFHRLRPTMIEVANRNPNITSLDVIYREAERIYEAETERQSKELLKRGLGPDVDIDKLKVLLSKARPAQISSAGGTSATEIVETSDLEERAKIVKAGILAADKLQD